MRTYQQACSLAHALDAIGERWTLLIIRELLTGTKRFVDLIQNLPGIGTNLLTKRLKELSQNGVIEKVSRGTYTLTKRGTELEPAILTFIRWGSLIPSEDNNFYWTPEWNPLVLKAYFDREKSQGEELLFVHEIEKTTYWVHIQNGDIKTGVGHQVKCDFKMSCTEKAFVNVFIKRTLSLEKALAQQFFTVDGSHEKFLKSLSWFPYPGSTNL